MSESLGLPRLMGKFGKSEMNVKVSDIIRRKENS